MLRSALAPSTKAAYSRSLRKFKEFCKDHNLTADFPASSDLVLQFISFLNLENTPLPSIMPVLSALSYEHKIRDFPDPCKSFKITQLLAAIKKQGHYSIKKNTP